MIQCVQNVQPSAETCNGVDDDCDGGYVIMSQSQARMTLTHVDSVDEGNPDGGASCSTGVQRSKIAHDIQHANSNVHRAVWRVCARR